MRSPFLIILIIIVTSCGSPEDYEDYEEEYIEEITNEYEEGEYCAEVKYYNPNTGTRSTYNLNIEVENAELTLIHWPSDGWLDEDHFDSEFIGEGSCSIISDRGYHYDIEILGDPCSFEELEVRTTLKECATKFGVTDKELEEYTRDFDTDINEPYTRKMCELLVDYIHEIRQIKGEMHALDKEVANGQVIKVLLFTAYNTVQCHLAIIKKHGTHYLIEVRGQKKCKMGTTDINHKSKSWQNIWVKEWPNDDEFDGYSVRILNSSSSKSKMETMMYDHCY